MFAIDCAAMRGMRPKLEKCGKMKKKKKKKTLVLVRKMDFKRPERAERG